MKKIVLLISMLSVGLLSVAQTDMFPEYASEGFNVSFPTKQMTLYSHDDTHLVCDSMLYYELNGMPPTDEHRWIQTSGGNANAADVNSPTALMCRMLRVFQNGDVSQIAPLYKTNEADQINQTYANPATAQKWQEIVSGVEKMDWKVSYSLNNRVYALVECYVADTVSMISPAVMEQEAGQWRFTNKTDTTAITSNFYLTLYLRIFSTDLLSVNDFDGDGFTNLLDICPCEYNPDQKDSDGDGKGDACDNCPYRHNPDQKDRDNDGAGDACDNCRGTYNPDQTDSDNDGVGDECDVCPDVFDPNQESSFDQNDSIVGIACNPDIDNDSIPNELDDDMDGDGWPNEYDNCPRIYNPNQMDSDGDGVGDVCDNCQLKFNPNQLDSDHDGIGDVCDDDSDGDGVPDKYDNCPDTFNPGQEDEDCNGIGDACQDF